MRHRQRSQLETPEVWLVFAQDVCHLTATEAQQLWRRLVQARDGRVKALGYQLQQLDRHPALPRFDAVVQPVPFCETLERLVEETPAARLLVRRVQDRVLAFTDRVGHWKATRLPRGTQRRTV
jgi:hypothetical protein